MFIETQNLLIRDYTLEDAPFILQMYNEPTYIQNIRDAGFRTVDDARNFLLEKVFPHHQAHGFGYCVVARRSDLRPIGQVGLVQRPFLQGPDLGFSFLMEFQGQGFGYEAASAFLAEPSIARFKVLHAFTSLVNPASQKLLRKLGFRDIGTIKYDQTDEDVRLFTKTTL